VSLSTTKPITKPAGSADENEYQSPQSGLLDLVGMFSRIYCFKSNFHCICLRHAAAVSQQISCPLSEPEIPVEKPVRSNAIFDRPSCRPLVDNPR